MFSVVLEATCVAFQDRSSVCENLEPWEKMESGHAIFITQEETKQI